MNQFTGLSIIIPTVDETRGVGETVEIISEICDKDDIAEILIIHSRNSSESHVGALCSLAARFSEWHVSVLVQPGTGLGDALFYGCSICKGSHFLMIGADREDDVFIVKKMLSLAKSHPNMIITTSRKLEKDEANEYSVCKRVVRDIFCFVIGIFYGFRQTDITYVYQITPKEYFDCDFFEVDHSSFVLELGLLAEIKKIPLMEIPTRISRRKEGSSHSGIKYYAGFVRTGLKLLKKR